jgi:hypothetical protein
VLANYGQDVLVSAQLVTTPGRVYLVVTLPFSTYSVGDQITDPTTIAFVTSYYPANVNSVLSTAPSIIVNTPPAPGSDVFASFGYVQDALVPVSQLGTAAFNLAVAASLQASTNAAQVAQVGTPTGVWNAATNSPVFGPSGAGGNAGQAWVVSAAGSTSLDGNAVWQLGDVVYNDGRSWIRFPFGGASGVLATLLMPKETFSFDGTSDGTKKLVDQYGNVMAQWTSAGLQTTGIEATTLSLAGAAALGGSLSAASLAAPGSTTTGSVALPNRLFSDNGEPPGNYAHMILDQYGNIVLGIGIDGTVHMPGIVASAAGVTLINPLLNSITINGTTPGLPLLAADPVVQTVTLAGTRVLSVDLTSTNSYEMRDQYGFIISAIDQAGVGTGLLSKATSSGSGGTGPSSAYSPAMAAQRDAMNVALSAQWKTERMSRYLPLTGNVIHFFGYGQSLAGGWYGVPVLNTTQPYDNVMIGAQTRAVANTTTTINWVPVGTPTSSGGTYAIYPFNPMIATASSEFVPAQGETPTETAINFLRRAYLQMYGKAADPDCIFMLTNTGVGGQTIAQLSKGASPELFNRNRDAANYVRAACVAAGKNYQVGGVVWTQGENDVEDGTTYATYTAEFKQLQADFLNDIVIGIAEQAGPIPWFCHQPGSNGTGCVNDVYQSLSDMAATFGSDLYPGVPISRPQHPCDRQRLQMARQPGRQGHGARNPAPDQPPRLLCAARDLSGHQHPA